MHYKKREKRYRENVLYSDLARWRYVVYKVQIGKFYYIGSSANIRSRISQHRCMIRKIAILCADGKPFLHLQPLLFHAHVGRMLSGNLRSLDKKLDKISLQVLYKGNVGRYKKENEFIRQSMHDVFCLNYRQA